MDGDRFLLWLRNRLLPAFDARYPGKRMYLVLDNATYHHVYGDDWFTPSQMNVTECVSFLQHHRVSSITASARRAVHLRSCTFGQRDKKKAPAPRAPSCRPPCARTSRRIRSINRTEVEKAMTAAGHSARLHASFRTGGAAHRAGVGSAKTQVARQADNQPQHRGDAGAGRGSAEPHHGRQLCSFIACCHANIERFMRSPAGDQLAGFASLQAFVDSLPAPPDRVMPMELD